MSLDLYNHHPLSKHYADVLRRSEAGKARLLASLSAKEPPETTLAMALQLIADLTDDEGFRNELKESQAGLLSSHVELT